VTECAFSVGVAAIRRYRPLLACARTRDANRIRRIALETWPRVSARQDPHTSRRYKGSRRRLENVASGYNVTGKAVPPRYVAVRAKLSAAGVRGISWKRDNSSSIFFRYRLCGWPIKSLHF